MGQEAAPAGAGRPPTVLTIPSRTQAADDSLAIYTDSNALNLLWKMAEGLAKATVTIPDAFRQKPSDVFAVLLSARSLRVDPMFALACCYVARGKIGFEAKFWIALCNREQAFASPITWTSAGKGDALSVTAHARLYSGEDVSVPLTLAECVANGWTREKSGEIKATWKGMPEQMLRWRTAAWLIRLYKPDIMGGMYSTEELQDIRDVEVEAVSNTAARLNELVTKEDR